MKKLLLISIMFLSIAVFAKENKVEKALKRNRITNNTNKTDKKLCADRGHIFDEDSTLFVPKNEAKTKSYIADFEDSTVKITPMPYNIQRVCLRCGKKVIEQTADKREVIWRRPVIIIDQPIIINGVEYD
jgi:hypothetical protein